MDITSPINQKRDSHFWVAIVVTGISILGVISISWILLSKASDNQAYQAAQSIFNAVLPMIGTWIGAIIAYYFGAKQVETIQTQQGQLVGTINKQMENNNLIVTSLQESIHIQSQQISKTNQ